MNISKLNFALIGCGRIAKRHAEHIKRLANLTAVCDILIERAEQISKDYGCKAFCTLYDLLQDKSINIDVVSICTPNGLHSDHAIACLKNGYHVLVEKPMALSVSECENMIIAAENSNKRLFVVKQNRFNPPVIALKKILSENRLGKIFSVQLNCFWNRKPDYYIKSDWKGKLKSDGGTLFTQFSHFIDLLYWLFGDITEVNAFMNNSNHKNIIEFEDNGVVILKFENDIIGTINYTVNSYKKNMEGSITVFGEKGTVKIGGQYLNKLEYQEIENYQIEDIPDSGNPNNYGDYQGSMSNHDKVYENVIDVFQKGSQISTSFLDGMKTVQIIEKIYKFRNINDYN